MCTNSSEEVLKKANDIRQLIKLEISEDAILLKLEIYRPTLFRYKNRIKKQIAKEYERDSKDSTKYKCARFKEALEQFYCMSSLLLKLSRTEVQTTCKMKLEETERLYWNFCHINYFTR
jgi:hypothetical protein